MLMDNTTSLEKLNKELENLSPQQQPIAQSTAKKQTRAKKKAPAKPTVIITMSRRKTATARASAVKGTGQIRINKVQAKNIRPVELRELIYDPLRISKTARGIAKALDISVNVNGGGISSQAYASRNAIAKALVVAAKDDSLKGEFMRYDRMLLVDDVRQVEPKKFKGPKARARFQKSYR